MNLGEIFNRSAFRHRADRELKFPAGMALDYVEIFALFTGPLFEDGDQATAYVNEGSLNSGPYASVGEELPFDTVLADGEGGEGRISVPLGVYYIAIDVQVNDIGDADPSQVLVRLNAWGGAGRDQVLSARTPPFAGSTHGTIILVPEEGEAFSVAIINDSGEAVPGTGTAVVSIFKLG